MGTATTVGEVLVDGGQVVKAGDRLADQMAMSSDLSNLQKLETAADIATFAGAFATAASILGVIQSCARLQCRFYP